MRFGQRERPKERSRSFRGGSPSGGWPYEHLLVTSQLVRAPGYSKRKAPKIYSAADVARMFETIEHFRQERLYAVLLSNANAVLGIVEVARGDRSGVDVDPVAIFAPAILANATGIIMVHNHPSGEPHLSAADVDAMRRAEKAGELLSIRVLDFIAIGEDGAWQSVEDDGDARLR